MPACTDQERDHNFENLSHFRNFWQKSKGYRAGKTFGTVTIPVIFRYQSDEFDIEKETILTINVFSGKGDGDLNLEDGIGLSNLEMHLHFSAGYQRYSFDEENGSLIVTGVFHRTRLNYAVVIRPI